MHQTYREATWEETNFALFYQAHASSVLDYLRMQTRTLEDAEDILVDVFMAARQHVQIAYERPGGQFAWLRQVARNKMVDYYRRQGQAQVIPLEQASSLLNQAKELSPEQALVSTETLKQLQATIQRLPLLQQDLLRLRFAEGLRCPQIAKRIGKREGAVRTMLLRTLKTLRGMYVTNQEREL